MLRTRIGRIVSILAAGAVASAAFAQTTPLTTTRIASGLALPLYVTAPQGDNNRLFIVEQRGSAGTANRADIKIMNLPAHTINGTPYLSISPVRTASEEGLLGLAFHPDFMSTDMLNPNRGMFFVYYTNTAGNNQVFRYRATGGNPLATTADSGSATLVITFSHPVNSNHNGGWIGFGPDGFLYIATGDGGSGNDPPNNAQNLNSLLGKMHRLNVNALPYTIPAGNPFAGGGGLPEIWHYGLRNPWRNAFDRATGALYIGDVGQNAIEEVSYQPPGVGGINYMWRCMEGTSCTGLGGCTCITCPTLVGSAWSDNRCPISTFSHALGRCSITGGYVYRGPAVADWHGTYFFADYCGNQIYTINFNGANIPAVTERTAMLAPGGGLFINSITSFGEDNAGEMYIVDQGGEIFKIIVNCSGSAINISQHPAGQTVCAGAMVNFSVTASGMRGTTTYVWKKGGVPVPGAPNAPSYTIPAAVPGDSGNYTVDIIDQCNMVTSNAATLTVHPHGTGDFDLNGMVNGDDIPPFVRAIITVPNGPPSALFCPANMVQDAMLDSADVDKFVTELLD